MGCEVMVMVMSGVESCRALVVVASRYVEIVAMGKLQPPVSHMTSVRGCRAMKT